MDNDKIIYSISIEDIETVREDNEFREFTPIELEKISDEIGNSISWYDVIYDSIKNVIKDIEDDD